MSLEPINQEGVLQALGFHPRDPKVQALALVAERYGLDLILKQVFLIQGTVYVSHAGLLSVAHRSGQLDGIEVEIHEDDKKWVATAKVYRKDMSRPFVYTDECYKNETKVVDKRKRAITRAERNALRRAFDVGCDVWEDDRPEPPVTLSQVRPETPRRPATSSGALPEGEGPHAPGLEASRAQPEPSPSGPTVDPGKSIVIRCSEMGLDDDERHALVSWATKGRTQSSKELQPKEAGQAHAALHHLQKYGEKLWDASASKTSTSSSPASSESPAPTTTPSEGPPAGDAASDAAPSSG
jgi:hypothetical protein